MIRNFVFKNKTTVVVTELLVPSILFSTSLFFVFKAVVVTKPLVSCIFSSPSPFSPSFVYLCCIDLRELK